MRTTATLLLLLFITNGVAQVSPGNQKALNAYMAYANESGKEVSDIVTTMFEQYEALTGKYPDRSRYTCPFQMQEYFINTVNTQSKNLPAASAMTIRELFAALRAAEKDVDAKCKSLDTYYKLEDYKRDQYAQARAFIHEIQPLVDNYNNAYNKLRIAIEKAYQLVRGSASSVYSSADQRLLKVVQEERSFLDTWRLNFNVQNYSGWSADKLEASITSSVAHLESLKTQKPALKYPASSMWENFQEVYGNYLEAKRRALDEHNYEASKNDKHNNEVYLELINYFNGTLVADYNTFLQFSERDGYFGLNTLHYVPTFEIAEHKQSVTVEISPFKDLPFDAVKVTKQKTSVPPQIFESLSQYIEFINETWRQTRSLQATLSSFNSSAAYFKTLTSFEKRQPLYIDYSKFQVPHSYFQKVIAASKALPTAHSNSLNTQAEVIISVLKEMDQLGASLDLEVKEKRYEKDHLKRVFEILEREARLFEIWDAKKEILYSGVRAIYDSYLPKNPESSWEKSGAALRALVDLNHEAVFESKDFYNGDTTVKIDIRKIEAMSRDIISKEYENLKGIEKLGRYNGNCPYSPYEDVPKTSRLLSEKLQKLTPRNPKTSRYNDPYYNIIYLYNDIVDDYNKFCDLSTAVPHLKNIFQPETFAVIYPDPSVDRKALAATNNVRQPSTAPDEKAENRKANPATGPGLSSTSNTQYSRDTIYIEKRDTIYIRELNEELRSMEGYATNNMVLLLDISGSMNQPDKLPLLKESVLRMLSMMRQEDKISIIAFASKPKILLKSASFKEEEKIRKAVSDLSSAGKTDGKAAIKVAYKIADEYYIRGGNNRIILATDGEFGIDADTEKLIQGFANDDIFLSIFNFGKGMGASKNLQNLANLGKGNYEAITIENVDVKLIKEAKGKRLSRPTGK